MLHAAIGQPAFKDRSLVLTRQKTEQAPVHHIANGGNAWDTVKPLQKHFGSRIHRIVLVDDDAYKVGHAAQGARPKSHHACVLPADVVIYLTCAILSCTGVPRGGAQHGAGAALG